MAELVKQPMKARLLIKENAPGEREELNLSQPEAA